MTEAGKELTINQGVSVRRIQQFGGDIWVHGVIQFIDANRIAVAHSGILEWFERSAYGVKWK